MAECQWKVGDVVKLVSVVPDTARNSYGWASEMNGFLGQVVTISTISGCHHRWPLNYIYIKEDERGYTFGTDLIECYADPELVEKMRLEKEERRMAMIKKHKKLVFTKERVEEIAVDIFGEERVDVVAGNGNGDGFDVIIHFPEIGITNSEGAGHVIRDLYVKLSVTPKLDKLGSKTDYKAFIEFSGRRRTFTLKEWESGYIHSHLHSGHWGWSGFCTGHSAFRSLLEETMLSVTEEAWTTLLLSIPNYVKWESIEGGPYTLIKNIQYRNQTDGEAIGLELERLIEGVPKNVWEINGGLNIIDSHPSLYEYFNENSKIRKMAGYASKAYKEAVKKAKRGLKAHFEDGGKMEWKGVVVEPEICVEEDVDGDGQIEIGVVTQYCNLLKEKSGTFLKLKEYGQRKGENSEKVFGKAGTVEQTSINNNEGITEKDSLLAF